MSSEWPIVALRDVCTFERGLTYAKSDETDFSTNVVLRANNVDLSTGTLNLAELKYLKSEFQIPAAKKVKKDSLLVCTASGSKSHLGKVALIDVEYDYAFGGFMGLLLPGSRLNSRYLYYCLTSPGYVGYIDSLTDGANINNLKFSQLGEFQIPLPPLEEQKRIVAKLDQALGYVDELDTTEQSSLQELDALWNSVLTETFKPTASRNQGTPVVSELKQIVNLGDLLTLEYGKGLDSSLRNLDGAYPVYGASGVKSYSGEYLVEGESIVIGRKGSAGQLTRVNGKFWPLDVTYYVQLKTNEVDIDYLFNWLDHTDLTTMAKGVKPGINRNEVYDLAMVLPTLDEQKRIVAKLDAIKVELDGLQDIKLATRAEGTAMRSSILSAAFAGDL